jgi:hypothetical protein
MTVAGWEREIAAAQAITTYELDGVAYARIRYGGEAEDWGAASGRPCHDCGVRPGQYHVPSCDAERCPRCLRQAISCGCADGDFDDDDDDDELDDGALDDGALDDGALDDGALDDGALN